MSIYPTLTDLCGIPTPAHVQGKSIRPCWPIRRRPGTSPPSRRSAKTTTAVRTEN